MANGFNITGQIILKGPVNINQVTSQLQRQLGNVNANVNLKLPAGLNNQFSTLVSQINSLNVGLNNLNKNGNLNKVAASATGVARPLKEAKTAAFQFGESIGEAARKFTAFSIAAGAMVGLISSIRQGIGAAVDFQHELVRLEQIGGNLNNSIGAISSEVTNLSTTLGVSSKELIGVSTTLRQAGLSAEDTRVALRGIAESSLAPTFTDIKNTVEGAIVAMQTFGLQAKDLYGVLGSINRVSADFAVESDDITQALRRSGGAFKSAGGSLNELIALFTSVRSTTRESAEAISSGFNTIFARLQRPEAIEQLRLMGVNLRYAGNEAKIFGKTEGEFVGPYEAIRRLNTALSNVPPASQEYAAIVELIGGFRQVSRVIPLIQQFGNSEKALQSAMSGTNSLTQSTIIAQKSLTVQLSQTGEKFLEVFRVLGSNKELQEFLGLTLKLTNGLLQIAKAAEPLVPLLGALALGKVASVVGSGFSSNFSKGLTSGLSGSGKRFATGGVVPGVGNSDSVSANLTPGEFVIRKSAAKAIGYNTLHSMNRYAVGGTVKDNEASPLNERYLSDDERERLRRQRKMMEKLKGSKIRMSEAAKRHYAVGGYVEPLRFANAGKVPASDKPFKLNKKGVGNTVYINPPNGSVAMLIPDPNSSIKKSSPDTLPVANLAPDSKKRFNADKERLIASGKMSRETADGILAVTTPIEIRSLDKGKKENVRGIIESNIFNSLLSIAGSISEPGLGASFTKADAQGVLRASIGANGVGRIFEGALNVIATKLGSKGLANKGNAVFDFAPVDTAGFSGLFGGDIVGKFGDAKIADTFKSRASMISKALRQFGFETGGDLQNRELLSPAKDDENKPVYARTKKGEEPRQLTRLEQIQKRIGGAKSRYQVGGKVNADPIKRFANGGVNTGTDTVPALLTPGEFVINREAAQRIGYNTLSRMNRYENGGAVKFSDRIKQFFKLESLGEVHDIEAPKAEDYLAGKKVEGFAKNAEVTKRLRRAKETLPGLTGGTLNIPFGSDKLALVGFGAVGEAGPNRLERSAKNLSDKLSDRNNKILEDLGINRVNVGVTRHIISNQATDDFKKTVQGPISSAIARAFKARFNDAVGDYAFSSQELASLEGALFQKYVQGVSRTRLDDAGADANRLFDFPTGINPSDNFNKIVLPSPISRGSFTDAKRTVGHNDTTDSIMAKYLNFRTTSLRDLIEGRRPITKTRGRTPVLSGQFNVIRGIEAQIAEVEKEQARLKSDPAAKADYEASLDRSIALKRLYKAEQEKYIGEFRSRRKAETPFATGGKVRSRFAAGGNVGVGTDTVPALLTPGEFVFNRESAQRIGYNTLARMNRYAHGGTVQPIHFATGRKVPNPFTNLSNLTGTATTSNTYTPPVNINQFPQSMTFQALNKARFPGNMQNPKAFSDPIVNALNKILQAINNIQPTIQRASRTSSQPNVNSPVSTGSQGGLFDRFKGRIGQFGVGAAVLGAQFLPQLTESVVGTADRPTEFGKRRSTRFGSNVEVGQGVAGAIAGGATGAAVGAIFGPLGSAVGLAIGGFKGFTGAMADAAEQIRNVQLDRDLKKFSNAISRATADASPLTSDTIGDVRGGIQSILTGLSQSQDKSLFLAEKVNSSELAQLGDKISRLADIRATDSQADQTRKFLEAGGGTGRDVANLLTRLPENKDLNLNQILKPFIQQGQRLTLERERGESLEKLSKATEIQTRLFGQLANALTNASAGLALLDDRASSTLSLAEGQYTPQPLRSQSVNAANFGTGINMEGVNRSIDFITQPLEGFGGRLAEDFNRTAKSVNVALDILPDALVRVVKGGVNPENFSKKVEDALNQTLKIQDIKLSPGVSDQFKRAISTFDLPDLMKKITTDIDGVTDDLIKHSFPNLAQTIQDGAKQLEDSIQSYQAGLSKYQDIGNKVGEAQDRVSSLQTEAFAAQRKILARRTGFVSAESLSPAETNRPFQRTQERLTNQVGRNAVDPTVIFNQLRETISRIGNVQIAQRTANPTEAREFEDQLVRLGSSASNLTQALQRLANPVERNAALQERLNAINAEEAQRLSLAERLAGASPQEAFQINRTANLTAGVASGQVDFRTLNDEVRKGILGFTHEIEDIRTPILRGLTGREFREALLRNIGGNTSTTARLPNNLEAQRSSFENQITNNLNDAIKAQKALANIMAAQQSKFFTELDRNQQAFLDQYRQLTLNAEKRDLQNQTTVAGASRQTAVTKQEAATTIKSAGFTDLGKAREFLSSPAIKDLREQTTQIQSLTKDRDNLSKNVTNLVSPKDFFATQNFQELNLRHGSARTVNVPAGQNPEDFGPRFLSSKISGIERSSRTDLSKIPALIETIKSNLSTDIRVPNLPETEKNRIVTSIQNRLEGGVRFTPETLNRAISAEISTSINNTIKNLSDNLVQNRKDIRERTGVNDKSIDVSVNEAGKLDAAIKILEGVSSFQALDKEVDTTTQTFLKLEGSLSNFIDSINRGFNVQDKTVVRSPIRAIDPAEGIKRFADGGSVFTPKGTDTVPAMLTPGEFVVNARSARANRGILREINSFPGARYYARGGNVKRKPDYLNPDFVFPLAGLNVAPRPLKFNLTDFPSVGEKRDKEFDQISGTADQLTEQAISHKSDVRDFVQSSSSDYTGFSDKLSNIHQELSAGIDRFVKDVNPIKEQIYGYKDEFINRGRSNIQAARQRGAASDIAINTNRNNRLKNNPELFVGGRDLSSATGGVSLEEVKRMALEKIPQPTEPPSPSIEFPAKTQQLDRVAPRNINNIERIRSYRIAEAARRKVLPSANIGSGVLRNRFVDTNVDKKFQLPNYNKAAERVFNRRGFGGKLDVPGLKPLNIFSNQTPVLDSRPNRSRLFNLRHPNAVKSRTRTRGLPQIFGLPNIEGLQDQIDGPPDLLRTNAPKVISNINAPSEDATSIRRRLINRRRNRIRRFADGGFASGTDVVPAMLTPGEFIVSKDAANANIDILNKINNSNGRVVYRAAGGRVGNGLAGNSRGAGDIGLSDDSVRAMRSFNDRFLVSVSNFNQGLAVFGENIVRLNGFANTLSGIINPLSAVGQNLQAMIPTFTQFNAAANNFSASVGVFNTASSNFAEAARSLAALPTTITHTIQGTNTVNVVVSVPEVLKSIKDEISKDILSKAVAQITSDIKSGKILG